MLHGERVSVNIPHGRLAYRDLVLDLLVAAVTQLAQGHLQLMPQRVRSRRTGAGAPQHPTGAGGAASVY